MIEDPESTDSDRPSKSERKRYSLELQALAAAGDRACRHDRVVQRLGQLERVELGGRQLDQRRLH